jgi:hypothetical protein
MKVLPEQKTVKTVLKKSTFRKWYNAMFGGAIITVTQISQLLSAYDEDIWRELVF